MTLVQTQQTSETLPCLCVCVFVVKLRSLRCLDRSQAPFMAHIPSVVLMAIYNPPESVTVAQEPERVVDAANAKR